MDTILNILVLPLFLLTPTHHFQVLHNGHIVDDGAIYDTAYELASADFDRRNGTDTSHLADGTFIAIETLHWHRSESCLAEVDWAAPRMAIADESLGIILNPKFTSDTSLMRDKLEAAFYQLLSERVHGDRYRASLAEGCVN